MDSTASSGWRNLPNLNLETPLFYLAPLLGGAALFFVYQTSPTGLIDSIWPVFYGSLILVIASAAHGFGDSQMKGASLVLFTAWLITLLAQEFTVWAWGVSDPHPFLFMKHTIVCAALWRVMQRLTGFRTRPYWLFAIFLLELVKIPLDLALYNTWQYLIFLELFFALQLIVFFAALAREASDSGPASMTRQRL